MATKTISITEEAYKVLKEKKEKSESFSQVIVRLSGKGKLSECLGLLSKSRGDALAANIKDARKNHRRMHEKRLIRL